MFNTDWQYSYDTREPDGIDYNAEQFYSEEMQQKETGLIKKLQRSILQDDNLATLVLKVLSYALDENFDIPEANKIAAMLNFDKLDFAAITGDFDHFKKVYRNVEFEEDF